MSEDLTLYRGESGQAHLVAFRCAHRGTQLSTGWVEGDNLRCFYHGWIYDGAGQCVEQPAEPEPFCSRIKIRSYPVQEYLGLIFVYLGEGDPPPLPTYPELEIEDGVTEARAGDRACNYFSNLENLCDSVHVSFVHRRSRAGMNDMPLPRVSGEESEWGALMRYETPGQAMRVGNLVMPNIVYAKIPPFTDLETAPAVSAIWVVPNDDEHHTQFTAQINYVTSEAATAFRERRAAWWSRLTHEPSEFSGPVLRGELRTDDVDEERDHVHIVRVQDEVAQIGQGVIADRSQEHLGHSDANLVLLRTLWAREMRALAEGRPLKEWTLERSLAHAVWARS
jgi:5,5'-dehydrodivanillate O-demethylase oxygenase subunit